MSEKFNIVEALRHARHDWMNRLQLIKGNLDLNRTDRARQLIDEMVIEAQNESKLSNVKYPEFVEWILTYNWGKHQLHIEFEVLDQESVQNSFNEQSFHWLKAFIEKLEEQVEPFRENKLSIVMSFFEEETCFNLDFNGILKEENTMNIWLQQQEKEITQGRLDIEEFTKEVFLFQVSFGSN